MPDGLPPVAAARIARAPDTKPWWRSRTLLVNAAVLALTAAESQLQVLQPLLPVNVYAVVALALPVVNAALRAITTQPLGAGPAAPLPPAQDTFIDTIVTQGTPLDADR